MFEAPFFIGRLKNHVFPVVAQLVGRLGAVDLGDSVLNRPTSWATTILPQLVKPKFYWMAVACMAISCRTSPPTATFESILNQPYHRLERFDFNAAAPILERVKPAPEFLLSSLAKADGKPFYKAYEIQPGDAAMVDASLRQLPPLVRRTMEERLVGIYFISDFSSNGMTNWVVGSKGELYGWIVLNARVLRETASELLTCKERSCFIPDGSKVDVSIDAGNGLTGVLVMLLHEGTHLVDMVYPFTPFPEYWISQRGTFQPISPFVQPWKSFDTPLAENDFPGRKDITFYGLNGGPRIPLAQAPALYHALAASPFVSLYGSQSWEEDLAETLEYHHLDVLLGHPCDLRVAVAGQVKSFPLRPKKDHFGSGAVLAPFYGDGDLPIPRRLNL